MALGSLADDRSDDEIAHMRDHAAAVARIVIRTYFGASRASSAPGGDTGPFAGPQESLGTKLNPRDRPSRGRRVRRRAVGRVDSARRVRRLRRKSTTQS